MEEFEKVCLFDDDQYMVVKVTHEGIIMDLYEDTVNDGVVEHGELIGTVGMMFDEWADWIKRRA